MICTTATKPTHRANAAFAAFLLGVFVLGLVLNTRHNDMPARFHPDEPSKVRQVIQQDWNFFHPQLLLNSVRIASFLVVGPAPEVIEVEETGWITLYGGEYGERVVRVGRWVAAVYASLAVVLLALTARLQFNLLAGYAVGILAVFAHALMVAAHYLKEDTTLIFGISLVALALAWLERRPSGGRIVLLGAALGVAAASKYVGLMMIPIALVAALWMVRDRPWRRRLIFAGLACLAAGAVFMLLNYAALIHPRAFISGLIFEIRHSTQALENIKTARLSPYYFQALWRDTTWPVLFAAAGAIVWYILTRRQRTASQWVLVAIPFIWFVMASLSPIQGGRYILPTTVFLYVLAGVGVAAAVASAKPHGIRVAAAVILIPAVAALGVLRCANYLDQFRNDSRYRLRQWVAEELPSDARLAADWYAGLPLAEAGGDPRVIAAASHVIKLGSVDDLVAAGFTHVAVCEFSYARFIDPYRVPGNNMVEFYRHGQAAYQELFDRGQLIWSAEPSRRIAAATNPVIRVYALPVGDPSSLGDLTDRGDAPHPSD